VRLAAAGAPPGHAPFRGSLAGALGVLAGGLVGGFGLSILGVLVLIAFGRPGGVLCELVVSEALLWAGFLSAAVLFSHRFGSGSLRRDVDLRVRPIDPVIGFGGGIVAHCVAALVLIVIGTVHKSTANPDAPVFGPLTHGALGWLLLVAITCVGAPLVEEIFFRGLLQGELVQRLGAPLGIGLTAVVFGTVHIANDPGIDGLIYAAGVGGAGLVLGTVRHMTGRLGSSIATHACFNGIALAALAVVIST